MAKLKNSNLYARKCRKRNCLNAKVVFPADTLRNKRLRFTNAHILQNSSRVAYGHASPAISVRSLHAAMKCF